MTGSLTVDVTVSDARWNELIPDAGAVVGAAADAAWHAAAGPACGDAEVSVLLADDATVRDLNRVHRGQDRPTNVLSFPLNDGEKFAGMPTMLGDVVLARGVVAREAVDQGKPVPAHLRHLVVHGVLHLMGYDHEAGPDAERMETLEISILADLGVPNPYRHHEATS